MISEDRSPEELLADALDDLAGGHDPQAQSEGPELLDGGPDGPGEEAAEPPAEDAAVEADDAPAPEPVECLPEQRPPTMRTRLREFGEQFDRDVRPLVGPIRAAADTVAAASGDWRGGAVLPALRELAHQVQMLSDKVSGQQAYVLIFGPLKSGKSTFMNAVCSAYVSEVTSLPAYPCIVNVSHGEPSGFVLTTYDGTTQALSDPDELHAILAHAHKELMDGIREVEAVGEDFEPARHRPDAIRKVDVRLPTGDLAESGAVLVDTPGLYSRMKFGYDQMTRDFRHAAACAIFIVKTDNLFLEQVFEEFQELLDLFSRVFLIVNLDVTKRDLAPDGSLVPSLEREDPQRIIEAFRDLSLSVPLKAAADTGRLRIYPVDLLHAASARIRRRRPADSEAQNDSEQGLGRFDELLGDLTDYLNSNEYLQEFLLDSLRRIESLLGELGDVTEHEEVSDLRQTAGEMRESRDAAVAQAEAFHRLKSVSWPRLAEELRKRLRAAAEHQAATARQETGKLSAAEVRKWFTNDRDLDDLTHNALARLLTDARDRCERSCREELARLVAGRSAGLSLPESVPGDLATAEVDLESIAQAALGQVPGAETDKPAPPPFRTDEVPVRRGFWDWVLLRSKRKVRKRLFGPANSPNNPIPAAMKAKRLGPAAEEVMCGLAQERASALLGDVAGRVPDRLADAYTGSLFAALGDLFARREDELRDRAADLEARLAEAERILRQVQSLSAEVGRTALAVDALRERFTPAEDAEEADDHEAFEQLPEPEADAEEIPPAEGHVDEQELPVAVDDAEAEAAEALLEAFAAEAEDEDIPIELEPASSAGPGVYRPVAPPPLPDTERQWEDEPLVLEPIEESEEGEGAREH
ncbi:MAG TPA: dynamin family protein [Phycisphaerae bacterium]|nr:dynamin family protein [Phycisphaerae bacterium]